MIDKKASVPNIRKLLIAFLPLAILMCCTIRAGFADESAATGKSFESFPYYKASATVDLKGTAYSFHIADKRASFQKLECANIDASNDTEFAGEPGLRYFEDYLARMTGEASGKLAGADPQDINIDLEVFCPRIFGFMFARVYGLVQFSVTANGNQKRYCFHLKDGDPDARLGIRSVSTRTGATRTLLASTTTKALEAFLIDLEKALPSKESTNVRQ